MTGVLFKVSRLILKFEVGKIDEPSEPQPSHPKVNRLGLCIMEWLNIGF